MPRAWLVFVWATVVVETRAELSFLRPTDLFGVASTFEPSDDIPTHNFTISLKAMQRPRKRSFSITCGVDLNLFYDVVESYAGIYLDSSSYGFDDILSSWPGGTTNDQLLLSWHM